MPDDFAGVDGPGHDEEIVDDRTDEEGDADADAHEAASGHEHEVGVPAHGEFAEVDALDPEGGKAVEPGVEVLGDGEEPELEFGEEGGALSELEHGGGGPGGEEQAGLGEAGTGIAVVEGVHDDPGGAPLGERELFVVDEAAFEGERHEHTEEGDGDHPEHRVEDRDGDLGDEHVGGEAREERLGHVAGRRRRGLHGDVLEEGELAAEPEPGEAFVEGEGEDDGRDADTDGPGDFGAEVEVGEGKHSAEQHAGEGGAEGELGLVPPPDVGEPPAVLLRQGPGADLVRIKLRQGHSGCSRLR
ncbi:MAG: hypothetical protein M5U12_20105 [Verrucomicrobia bacterium]|nr:hypothetical protein [Verrucomicrobiota bacterium]